MNQNRNDRPATPDDLWKTLIETFFRDFVAFFKPELLSKIDFGREEFLNKELLSITGKQKKGIVDVLVKVYLINGDEEFILFHIEVQGYRDDNFPERVFGYFIRIWDKYKKPVLSYAIVTHKNAGQAYTNTYRLESFGTVLSFQYNLFNVETLNYQDCLTSQNPVEVVMGILAPVKKLPKWKKNFEVMRALKRLGLTPDRIHLLFSFVDRLSQLTERQLEKFKEYTYKEERDIYMIMTSFEERGLKRGKIEGKREGKIEGKREGKIEGKREGIKVGKKNRDQEIISRMYERGLSITDISEYTGLLEKDVMKILNLQN